MRRRRIFRFLGSSISLYVHLPSSFVTFNRELYFAVCRESSHNNDESVSRNPVLSRVKILYYKLFAWAYGVVGGFSSLVMVNSTWTRDHIDSLWSVKGRLHVLFPPCDCTEMQVRRCRRRFATGCAGRVWYC